MWSSIELQRWTLCDDDGVLTSVIHIPISQLVLEISAMDDSMFLNDVHMSIFTNKGSTQMKGHDEFHPGPFSQFGRSYFAFS
jgi:hypothetical protein